MFVRISILTLYAGDNGQIPNYLQQSNCHPIPAKTHLYHGHKIQMRRKIVMKLTVIHRQENI